MIFPVWAAQCLRLRDRTTGINGPVKNPIKNTRKRNSSRPPEISSSKKPGQKSSISLADFDHFIFLTSFFNFLKKLILHARASGRRPRSRSDSDNYVRILILTSGLSLAHLLSSFRHLPVIYSSVNLKLFANK